MDWYSWLSKSGLDPSSVYDYSLLLAENELEEVDIPHFNHEFLLSMGISIAKHRLEILKLAKSNKKIKNRIRSAVLKTKKCVSRYFRTISSVGNPSKCDVGAIVVVPTSQKPERKLLLLKRARLMITDGGRGVKIPRPGTNAVSHSASPMAYTCRGEEMRWDSMFQDLRPT